MLSRAKTTNTSNKNNKTATNQNERNARRGIVWTRDKISHLIHLYRQQECLWNHYVEEYRNRDQRAKAIESICTTLRISKFDFGKKIHNLRNQFNSEMKKLERRIEEAGGNIDDMDTMKEHRCRWEHFEALKFLAKIIEPRPGFQNSFQTPKKLRLKYEEGVKSEQTNDAKSNSCNNEEIHEFHLEESTASEHFESNTEDFQEFEAVEEELTTIEREATFDDKYNTTNNRSQSYQNNLSNKKETNAVGATITSKTYYTCVPKANLTNQQTQPLQQDLIHIEDNAPLTTNSVIELSNSGNREHGAVTTTVLPARDQWDTFGELVANEFRLLNSDASRKKLKRKIMQDLLLIGEEDDKCAKEMKL